MNYPYGVIAYNLRGRGGSGVGTTGLKQHANDLVRIIRHFKLDFAQVVGHQFGGYVACKAAQIYPERIGAINLIDSGIPTDFYTQNHKNYFENQIKPKEYSSREEYYEEFKKNTELEINIDLKQRLDYDLKEVSGKFIRKLNYEMLSQDNEDILNSFSSLEGLWNCKFFFKKK
jgi:pimeloyl-ACP methyl ester carboxylesterase